MTAINLDPAAGAMVRAFAAQQANAVFAVWEADGDFMARRAEARTAIDKFAAECGPAMDEYRTKLLQGIGFGAFCEHYGALLEEWDGKRALEVAAQERSPGRRRRRQSNVRSVFR